MIDIPYLTKAQRWSVINRQPIDGFSLIDIWGIEIGRNDYHLDVHLAVIMRDSDMQLFGVPWGQHPHNNTIGYWNEEYINIYLPLVPLKAKTIYESAGESLLSELDLQF